MCSSLVLELSFTTAKKQSQFGQAVNAWGKPELFACLALFACTW